MNLLGFRFRFSEKVCIFAIRCTVFSSFVPFYCAAYNAAHGIAVAILSIPPSVCPSDVCNVTKLNDVLGIF